MDVLKTIWNIYIFIFCAFAIVTARAGFCHHGKIIHLKCPHDSLITGIETTGYLFSADATPVCSKIVKEVLPDSEDTTYYDTFYRWYPRIYCKQSDYVIKSISLCSEKGRITETVAHCRPLRYVVPTNATYTVVVKPTSPALKCREGSVLKRIHMREGETIAECLALDVGNNDRVTNMEKDFCHGDDLFRVACPDGYLVTGVETRNRIIHASEMFEIFSPGNRPVCSKVPDKILHESTSYVTQYYYRHEYYYENEIPLLRADCGGRFPVLVNFSMCSVDRDVISRTLTVCRGFYDNVEITAYYNIEAQPDSSMLKCPEGSYLSGFRTERDEDSGSDENDKTHVRIRAQCIVVDE